MARKEKNIHYIYKTTCNVTGRWYVGMHSTINENDGYMGSGKVLRYSIRKYGIDNHTKEILEYCDSREVLVLREIEIVTKELISDGFCMNLKEGGYGGFSSEEHMVKCHLSGAKTRLKRWNEDIEFIEKNKLVLLNNVKQAHKNGNIKYNTFEGKYHSEESKQLMSEKGKLRVGEGNSQYGTCWITNGIDNKKIKKNTEIPEGWYLGRK